MKKKYFNELCAILSGRTRANPPYLSVELWEMNMEFLGLADIN